MNGKEFQQRLWQTLRKMTAKQGGRVAWPIVADVLADPEAHGYTSPLRTEVMQMVARGLEKQGHSGSHRARAFQRQLISRLIQNKKEEDIL